MCECQLPRLSKYYLQEDASRVCVKHSTAIECWNILKYEIESIIDKYISIVLHNFVKK